MKLLMWVVYKSMIREQSKSAQHSPNLQIYCMFIAQCYRSFKVTENYLDISERRGSA